MKFGIQISPYITGSTGNPWDAVLKAAETVDKSLFESIWLFDHFLYDGGYSYHPYPEPVLECFTALSAIAAVTRRVRLGQLVLGVPYRNPAMVAKMATTLDLISHGRSILGMGAGWHRREFEAYGWGEFESVSVRMKRLKEALQVILALWGEQPADFNGQYYSLNGVLENPMPMQRPHPPILIGGSGEKATLRLVAQYGQYCNVWGDPDKVKHLFEVLRNHCTAINRSYDEIIRSVQLTVVIGHDRREVKAKQKLLKDFIPGQNEITLFGTSNELINIFKNYANVGCQYIMIRMPDWSNIEPLHQFAEQVIPALDQN